MALYSLIVLMCVKKLLNHSPFCLWYFIVSRFRDVLVIRGGIVISGVMRT